MMSELGDTHRDASVLPRQTASGSTRSEVKPFGDVRSAVGSSAWRGTMGSHRPYDLIVLGSGPAGDSAAQLAASAGHRVAIVERLRSPGGVVVANGGVPTKTLRESAMYLTGFMDRRTYGIGLALQPELLAERLASRTEDVCR